MNDLRTQTRDTGWRRRRRTVPSRLIDVAAAGLFALIVTAIAVRSPSRTPDITIDNPTSYDLTIKVSDRRGDDWMGFALVNAQSQAVARAPIDEGSTWIFDFGAGGQHSVSRAELRAAGWHYRVPDEVRRRLETADIAPSPQRAQR